MQRIKKVMASVASGLMAGATLMAPVLAEKTIGEAFSEMNPENTVVVVGANAATSDVVAAIAIGAEIGQHGAGAVVSGSGSVTTEVTGGVSLDDPSDKLYVGDPINKVRDSLTAKDLPSVLAKGTLEDDEGTTYDYSQYIEIGSNQIKFDQYETDEDPVVAIELGTSSTDPLYTYRVDFNKVVNFIDTDDDGRNIMAGNTLELGGVAFTISSESTDTKLVLYKSSESITVSMGEEKTVTVNGVSYTIKVLGFDTNNDEVVLSVNGVTDSVAEGRSRTIGGLEVYAKTVTGWNNGADGIAILQVGSEKVTLEDGQEVMIGDDEDPIDGTEVEFVGTVDALSSIKIKVYAPDTDNDYIAAGSEFKDPVFESFKVKFADIVPDLKDASRDEIEVKNDGDSKGYVKFKDINGDERELYFVYDASDTGVELRGSASDENIYVVEGSEVVENEITMLAPGNERYTHIVKVTRIYSDDERGYVEFEDVLTGEKYETKEGVFNDEGNTLELIVDGKTYIVTAEDGGSDGDTTPVTKISVAYNDGVVAVYPSIELNNGENLAITDEVLAGDEISAETIYGVPTGYIKVVPDTTNDDADIYASVDGVTWTTVATDVSGDAAVQVGSVVYNVNIGAGETAIDVTISLDADQDPTTAGNIGVPAVLIVEEEDDNNVENAVIIAEDGDSDYVSFDAPIFTAGVKFTDVGTSNDDVTAYLDYYGTYAEKDSTDDDHTIVRVYYPDTQMYARIAMGTDPQFGAASTTTGSADVSFKPVTADMAKLDTEVSSADKSSKNIVLVGGPAINSLVAELANAGKTLTLDQWRTEYQNKAIVQVIEDAFATGKVALVVAGYSAQDTRNAAAALLTGKVDSYTAAVISGDTVSELTLPAEETNEE
ncbi:MAG: S-layer protein [Candidatus Nanohaloarchaeota archaeon]|nr:S-layer protein [Candidatus Nanohaloarchaeota archaeon]